MISGIIFAIGGFIEALIGIRFIFLLLGANPNNLFVNWIYDWSSPLVAPFANIFGQSVSVISDVGAVVSSVFDWAALVAMLVYGLVFTFLGSIFRRRYA